MQSTLQACAKVHVDGSSNFNASKTFRPCKCPSVLSQFKRLTHIEIVAMGKLINITLFVHRSMSLYDIIKLKCYQVDIL